MKIKTTTALRKISALKKRIWGIQGGQGAGKTIAILILILNYAIKNKDKEIFIVSAELSKMRITVIKDFINILRFFNLINRIKITDKTLFEFPNNTFIKFIGLDKEDIGKGLRSDLVFVNEANKIKFETYRETTSRAKRIIIDFNPNKEFWFHQEVKERKDCDFLKLTYLDNECCPENEINEILSYKERGYDGDGNVINEYWANKWRIYGLGEIGGVEGRIFYWNSIDYLDYLKIDRKPLIVVDWGKVDPFAVCELKYKDGKAYVHELNYKSENEWRKELNTYQVRKMTETDDEGFVTWLFEKLGINKELDIICDNNRPQKIYALRKNGWENALAVRKWKIIEKIDLMQNLEIYYTKQSKNIEQEQLNYCWKKDRYGITLEEAEDKNNHTIDAISYGLTYLTDLGVIKKL